MLFVGADIADHHIGMPADVFCRRLDRQIDAARQCRKEDRRAPGIIHQHRRAARVRHLRNRWHVLHFECQRARTLAEHRLGIWAELRGDVRTDQRVVVACFHAVALEHAVAEMAGRPIAAVDHQNMIARTANGKDRRRNRVQAGGHAESPRGAFQRADRFLEATRRRRAAPPIGETLLLAARQFRLQGRDVGVEDGRGAIDRRVDRAEMLVAHPSSGDRDGFGLVFVVRHSRHPLSLTRDLSVRWPIMTRARGAGLLSLRGLGHLGPVGQDRFEREVE